MTSGSPTNARAFNPTDPAPLSGRATLLTGTRATAALIIAARAVGAIR